jgi:hypothetical protein
MGNAWQWGLWRSNHATGVFSVLLITKPSRSLVAVLIMYYCMYVVNTQMQIYFLPA